MREKGEHFYKSRGEITGGRVPMSDITKWAEDLQTGPRPLTKKEIGRFVKTHLVQSVINYAWHGQTQEECLNGIIKEVETDHGKPDVEEENDLKNVIAAVYDRVAEEPLFIRSRNKKSIKENEPHPPYEGDIKQHLQDIKLGQNPVLAEQHKLYLQLEKELKKRLGRKPTEEELDDELTEVLEKFYKID